MFRYGDENGPVGAAIFDGQGGAPASDNGDGADGTADAGAVDAGDNAGANATEPETGAEVELENGDPNLFLQMVGYRLLPRYWELERFEPLTVPADDVSLVDPLADVLVENTLPQFVATPGSADNLDVFPISAAAPFVVQGGELLLQGGNTHLTSVWWDAAEQDYQIAQVYASGGLQRHRWSGVANEGALLSVEGDVRLFDRSWLCRRYRFERRVFLGDPPASEDEVEADVEIETDVDPDADSSDEALVEVEVEADVEARNAGRPVVAILYDQRPLGIRFCGEIPEQPFYPEAVALAYFLEPDARDYLVDQGENAQSPDVLEEIIAPLSSQTESGDTTSVGRRVLDVRARATLPGPNVAAAAAPGNPPSNARLLPVVCIDFLDGFERIESTGDAVQTTTFAQRRQVLFTLTYRVPVEDTLDDALRILNVRDVSGPIGLVPPCELLVDQRPPAEDAP